MPIGQLVGALLPAALGAFGGGGKRGRIERIPTHAPWQQRIIDRLGPWMQERVGKGLPRFEGEMVAPLGEEEKFGMGRLGQMVRGWSPEHTAQFYEKYIAPEEMAVMERDIIPRIREEFVPGGGYWGSPRMEAVGEAWERYGAEKLGRMGRMIGKERERAARMMPEYMRAAALPRAIRQAELLSEYEEFLRTTPELSPIIQQAMQLLQMPTQAAYHVPPQQSPFAEFMGALAPGFGYGLGQGWFSPQAQAQPIIGAGVGGGGGMWERPMLTP